MSAAQALNPLQTDQLSRGENPLILSDIYRDAVNLVVWQRDLGQQLDEICQRLLALYPSFQTSLRVCPSDTVAALQQAFPRADFASALFADIAELVDMFACLFDLEQVGLRLTAMQQAMCPKFHVDQVPCRLVSTYSGAASQWLSNDLVQRPDQHRPQARIAPNYQTRDIQQLATFDVALLKGEKWLGNENRSVVHRSPDCGAAEHYSQSRLLLTLDFA